MRIRIPLKLHHGKSNPETSAYIAAQWLHSDQTLSTEMSAYTVTWPLHSESTLNRPNLNHLAKSSVSVLIKHYREASFCGMESLSTLHSPPAWTASISLSYCFLPSNAHLQSQMPSLNLIKMKKLLIASITLKSCAQLYPSFSPDSLPLNTEKSSPAENQIL